MGPNIGDQLVFDRQFEMDTEANKISEALDFLQPELFSLDKLQRILSERCPYLKIGPSQKKEELVSLFYEHVTPKPQRKYRNNRNGRKMMQKQIRMNKKRKHDDISSTMQPPEENRLQGSQLVSSFKINSPTGDRIKPPPSVIDPNRTKIKLGGSKTNLSDFKPQASPVGVISLDPNNSAGLNLQSNSMTVKTGTICLNQKSWSKSPTSTDKNHALSPNGNHLSQQSSTCTKRILKHADEELPEETKVDAATQQLASEDGVVNKKFKKISIAWP